MDLLGLILLIFFYICQVLIYAFLFLPILKRNKSINKDKPGLSVIICAKNESSNLQDHLPLICSQDYPNFEVVLMDDHSTDNTRDIVQKLGESYSNLRYFHASESIKDVKGKKKALEEAKSNASHGHFILTDADCEPSSSKWLSIMMTKFTDNIDIVLGIGQYKKKKGLLNSIIQYETMFTAMSYLGMAVGGSPYMGVGRNLAYAASSSSIRSERGTELVSGDDDLYLQSRFDHENTAICIEKDAQTISASPESYKSWIRQKSRHYSTSSFYTKKSMVQLLAIKSSFYMPNFLVIYLLLGKLAVPVIALFTLRSVIYWSYWNKMRQELNFPRRIYFLPCYELFFSLFDIWITSKNLMKIPKDWK